MTASNPQELKDSIMNIIQDDNYDINDLKGILDPITKYTENQNFVNNLKQIINVILEDRDGNNKFTVNDLKLLGKDMFAISTILSGLVLVIGAIPQLKLKYNKGATEELIFKLLAYIFIVIVPKEIGHSWTLEEKKKVVDSTIHVYQLILSSRVTKDIIKNVVKWFKNKGWCKCIGSSEEAKQQVVDKHMPEIKASISTYVQREKTVNGMQSEIDDLRQQIANLSNNGNDQETNDRDDNQDANDEN